MCIIATRPGMLDTTENGALYLRVRSSTYLIRHGPMVTLRYVVRVVFYAHQSTISQGRALVRVLRLWDE